MSIREVLANNFEKLLADNPSLSTVKAIIAKDGGTNGTLGRIRKKDVDVGIDKLEKLAAVYGIKPWQLLAEDLGSSINKLGGMPSGRSNLEPAAIESALSLLGDVLLPLDQTARRRAGALLADLAEDPKNHASLAQILKAVIASGNRKRA